MITRAYVNEPGRYLAQYDGADAARQAVAYVRDHEWPVVPRNWPVQIHVHFADGSIGDIWCIVRAGTPAWSTVHPELRRYLP